MAVFNEDVKFVNALANKNLLGQLDDPCYSRGSVCHIMLTNLSLLNRQHVSGLAFFGIYSVT